MPRRSLAAVATVAVALVTSALAVPTHAASSGGFAVGVPTLVDPIRSAPEPHIAIDDQGNPWITGPAGSSTQTSWFFHSRDGGLTYDRQGPRNGHWVCGPEYGTTGGGDSLVTIDHTTDDVYVTDQQALVSLGTGRLDGGKGSLASRCFSTPAMTADRPFETMITSKSTPQVRANGGKPINYMSWACQACLGGGTGGGGLAFAWSGDGLTWHAADPGVPSDNLLTNQFFEAPAITNFHWHGTMVSDPKTGYVYTALSCTDSSCPNGLGRNEVGIVVAKPGADRTDPSNVGQFASESYVTAAHEIGNEPMPASTALFPVIAMDRAGTIYEAWIQDDGTSPGDKPLSAGWHVYYTYSKDKPEHKVWAPARRVDTGRLPATNVMVWVAAGAPGKAAFTWLGTPTRQNPSTQDDNTKWWPFMAVVTGADTSSPRIYQQRIGRQPSHTSDICLQGTLCGATVPPGNRNMADFISIDIAPNGAAQATWANDANRVVTNPNSLVPGVPLTETARAVSGPNLLGPGSIRDSRFSTTPRAAIADRIGDVRNGFDAPQLDLTKTRLEWRGGNLLVHVSAADLSQLTSPASDTPNVWWLVTWKHNHHVYFARAQSNAGGALSFAAGEPKSYDRPGLTYYTVPTLMDYRAGTEVTGSRHGNEITIRVPANLVGAPKTGAILESVTGWTVLDNGLPVFTTAAAGNVPDVTDATPAFDFRLVRAAAASGSGGNSANPATGGGGAPGSGGALPATGAPLAGAGIAALVLLASAAVVAGSRRRRTAG